MKIRLLPSTSAQHSQFHALTTFLVNDRIAIDAGSLGIALAHKELSFIRDIVITHAHMDHIASLPIFIDEVYASLDLPLNLYCLPEVAVALRTFIFNDQIWPNFEKIPLINQTGAAIEFHMLKSGKAITLSELRITPVRVNHVVPTVGLILEDETSTVILTSDTYSTDELWQVAKGLRRLDAIFVEVSFPNELAHMAAASKHLTPELLEIDLRKLNRSAEIYVVHIKPNHRDKILRQLAQIQYRKLNVAEIDRVYEW